MDVGYMPEGLRVLSVTIRGYVDQLSNT
jgi:hypothetical protein